MKEIQSLRYMSDGSEVRVGDNVLVETGVKGRVVCDFDRRECLPGYDKWLTQETLVGGGPLSTAIMVETQEMGLVHYPSEDEEMCESLSQS